MLNTAIKYFILRYIEKHRFISEIMEKICRNCKWWGRNHYSADVEFIKKCWVPDKFGRANNHMLQDTSTCNEFEISMKKAIEYENELQKKLEELRRIAENGI